MALHDVYMLVDFVDAAERTATVSYLLRSKYDDATPASISAVEDDANGWLGVLETLSMASIGTFRLCIEFTPGGGGANVAANNQVRAFARVLDENGAKGAIEIPSWDDVVFDQNAQNMLSTAFNVALDLGLGYLRNPATGADFSSSAEYAQSRTHKSRTKIHD